MVAQGLTSVFANVAAPQKIVLIVMVVALPTIVFAAVLAYQAKRAHCAWARIVSELRLAGPVLGLLVAAMNGFHMGQTILRLPFDPTAKQLAPGILEVATLAGLGALVGIVAMAAHGILGLAAARDRS